MKAILATAPGTPDVLQLREIPMPELPSPHHLRVKLAAASVNPVDTKLRAKPAYHPDKLPAILGCDGAGIVDAVGEKVTRFKVGDQVFFCNGGLGDEPGNYAEYTTLHEDHCAAKPTNLGFAEAAALPLVFITAWEALTERSHLRAGQAVLVHGGAGGVGHVAIQLARHMDARVAATVSDERKAEIAQEFGAEKIIDYKVQDFVQETLAWTEGKGAGVVLDTVGGDTFLRSLDAIHIGGKLVTILGTPLSASDVQKARLRNLSLCYELMLTPQILGLHDERIRQRKILEQAARLVEREELHVLVSHRLPLAEAAEAHRLLEKGGMAGKIVLTMG
jgi:NADPH2:quinone reductase